MTQNFDTQAFSCQEQELLETILEDVLINWGFVSYRNLHPVRDSLTERFLRGLVLPPHEPWAIRDPGDVFGASLFLVTTLLVHPGFTYSEATFAILHPFFELMTGRPEHQEVACAPNKLRTLLEVPRPPPAKHLPVEGEDCLPLHTDPAAEFNEDSAPFLLPLSQKWS